MDSTKPIGTDTWYDDLIACSMCRKQPKSSDEPFGVLLPVVNGNLTTAKDEGVALWEVICLECLERLGGMSRAIRERRKEKVIVQ